MILPLAALWDGGHILHHLHYALSYDLREGESGGKRMMVVYLQYLDREEWGRRERGKEGEQRGVRVVFYYSVRCIFRPDVKEEGEEVGMDLRGFCLVVVEEER